MMLAIDIGNTETVLGLFRGEDLTVTWRLRTIKNATADEFEIALRSLFQAKDINIQQVTRVMICSVVPELDSAVQATFKDKSTVFVDHSFPFSFKIGLSNPRQVGADRLVNAEAALAKFESPLILVDAGTATTFCVISKENTYLGGAIAPGIDVSTKALVAGAAKLTSISLEIPEEKIGSTTESALKVGSVLGHAKMIDGLVSHFQSVIDGQASVIATGGLISVLKGHLASVDAYEPELTLHGLNILSRKV